jgi:hypothetical protein
MGVSGQRHNPAVLYPQGKDPPPVTIVQEAGVPEPVWTQRLEEKSSCLCRGSNLDHPVVQSAARHYTDWATSPPTSWLCLAQIILSSSEGIYCIYLLICSLFNNAFSVTQTSLYSIGWKGNKWNMNLKGRGRKRLLPYLGSIPTFAWRDWEKPRTICQDNRSAGRDLKPGPLKQER